MLAIIIAFYTVASMGARQEQIIVKRQLDLVRAAFPFDPQQPYLHAAKWGVGFKGFVPLSWLLMGQVRISYDNVNLRIEKLKSKSQFGVTASGFPRQHDDGRSILSLDDPVTAVLSPFGLLLLDGHHMFFANLMEGALTMPIQIIGDYRNFPKAEFWDVAEEMGLAFLTTVEGDRLRQPPQPEFLMDDPNRYLVAIIKVKVQSKIKAGSYKIETKFSDKISDPIWIKTDHEINYLEFILGDILRSYNIIYKSSWSKELPKKVTQQVRKIFIREQKKDGRFAALNVIPFSKAKKWQKYSAYRLLNVTSKDQVLFNRLETLATLLNRTFHRDRLAATLTQWADKYIFSSDSENKDGSFSKEELKSFHTNITNKKGKLPAKSKIKKIEKDIVKLLKWYEILITQHGKTSFSYSDGTQAALLLKKLLILNEIGIFKPKTSRKISRWAVQWLENIEDPNRYESSFMSCGTSLDRTY